MRSRTRLLGLPVVAALIATMTSLVTGSTPVAAAIAPPDCQVSAAAVPLVNHHIPYFTEPFVSLTLSNSHGTWAGLRYPGDFTIQVITWRAGHTTILDTFDYRSQAATYTDRVSVIGIDDGGSVVVDGIPPKTGNYDTLWGYRYQNGHRYVLAHNSDWLSFDPTSVAPGGQISGLVHTRRLDAVVEWTGSGSGGATVVSTGVVGAPLVDRYGDFLWTSWAQPHHRAPSFHVRTPLGRQLQLGGFGPFLSDTTYQLSSGRYLWGMVSAGHTSSTAVWDMSVAATRPSGGSIPLSRLVNNLVNGLVRGADSGGYVVAYPNGPSISFRYFDPLGDVHGLPAAFAGSVLSATLVGISANGTVAETGMDGNVRFISCGLHAQLHQPGGRLYSVAVGPNSVTIAGGVLDPDALAAPVSIDIIESDQAVAGAIVGHYVADQTSNAAPAVWYRLERHSFDVTFWAPAGPHTFCVFAENRSLGDTNPNLGCVDVTVPFAN